LYIQGIKSRLRAQKEKEPMSRKIFAAVLIFLSMATGCAALSGSEVGEKATPLITQSFASKEVRSGDTWKVYLKASDPNGEIKNIYAVIDQPGVGQYPLSIIRVKPENQKELSGYIYLSTATPVSPLNFVNLWLTIHVQDRSGNFSQPAVFPLSINARSTQEVPPQGVFKEEALGPVMVVLRTIQGGGGGDGGFGN
jgi:hypothetical protein